MHRSQFEVMLIVQRRRKCATDGKRNISSWQCLVGTGQCFPVAAAAVDAVCLIDDIAFLLILILPELLSLMLVLLLLAGSSPLLLLMLFLLML